MDTTQLTIDGGEVPYEEALRTSRQSTSPGLTLAQQLILSHVREHGSIRSSEAGRIVHGCRGHCGHGAKSTYRPRDAEALGCCPYASADGLSALQRGMVSRGKKAGVWS